MRTHRSLLIPITALAMSLALVLAGNLAVGALNAKSAQVPQGFARWEWLKSSCENCEIEIIGTAPEMQTREVQGFIATLAARKPELVAIYGIQGSEYNLLAHMAIGILGRESKFFESKRYLFKEQLPEAVYFLKLLKVYYSGYKHDSTPNSRGPTQIKVVPRKIAEHYGITPETLRVPENAALATMGFLIEALSELKRRIVLNKLDYIHPDNYVDYLPYLYFGSTKTLVAGNAHPTESKYITEMKHHMEAVEIYERVAPLVEVAPPQ